MLPASGPQSSDITDGASSTLPPPEVNSKYALVDLSQVVVSALSDLGPSSLYGTFGTGRAGPPEILVGVGDSLQVTIFESASGGLFIPADAGSRPGNYVSLPSQTVDQAGFIAVPYAGTIRVKGRTLSQIQREIETKLASRAIEPQAVVALTTQTSSQATVIGQVGAPTKININPAGDRVLDVLARASGIHDAGYETFVTLQRQGRTATTYFLNMVNNPKENVFVQPGDVLYVFAEKRVYIAFGATASAMQMPFDREHLTLNDAVGKVGGLKDERADPARVFVYRIEKRSRLEKMRVDLSAFPPEEKNIPTIYRTNFRDPSGFFLARNFYMQNQDVLYVSNADKVELFKMLDLITAVTGAGATSTTDVYTARTSVRALGH